MSKKIIGFTVLFFMLQPGAKAQFKRGMRMVGASVGVGVFNSNSAEVSFPPPTTGYTSKENAWSVNLSPLMGWFISDNTVIGGTLLVNPNGSKTNFDAGGNNFQQDKANAFNLGLGAFGRNYFGGNSKMMPFGQVGLNLGVTNKKTSGFFYGGSGPGVYKLTYSGKSSSGFFANASLSLGLTNLVNTHAGFDLYFTYVYSYNKNTIKTTTLRDDGNNGSVDQTSVSEPTTKFTNHSFTLSAAFQLFLDAKK